VVEKRGEEGDRREREVRKKNRLGQKCNFTIFLSHTSAKNIILITAM
jgi:hypothetical protein